MGYLDFGNFRYTQICQVCHHFRSLETRGGNARLKPGRLSFNTANALASRLEAMSPASLFSPTLPPSPSTHTNKDMLCTICIGLHDRPVELGCGNLVCLLCCTKWLTTMGSDECPCCPRTIHDHTQAPSKVTMAILGDSWWSVLEAVAGWSKLANTSHTASHSAKPFFTRLSTPRHEPPSKTCSRRTRRLQQHLWKGR